MAAPTLQAQGTIVADTTADLTVTLPTYAAYDIVVVQATFFGPNSNAFSLLFPDMNAPWSLFLYTDTNLQSDSTNAYVRGGIWWARATSATSLGTTATVLRGQGFDTGPDTCFAARAYVIRGCDPNGDPFDHVNSNGYSANSTVANPQLPVVTVLGTERLVIHFMAKTDNTGAPTAATGYTVGTAATTTTGTDALFQTYRQTANANTTAVTPTGGTAVAANNGSSAYFSVAFRPNNPRYALTT